MANISQVTHPDYNTKLSAWEKCRTVFEGGLNFLDAYLERYSSEEEDLPFQRRKKLTPIATHAKAAIVDVKNAIFQRMVDVVRNGGSDKYTQATKGQINGVDRVGNSMTSYIGTVILPDLLSIGKVGVLIDAPTIKEASTLAEGSQFVPYLVAYHAEDIRSWATDTTGKLTALLLRNYSFVVDETTGLTVDRKTTYKLYQRIDAVVKFTEYEIIKDKETGEDREVVIATYILEIPVIPFVIFDLGISLLEDVANHQIALLNMNSADVDYSLRSNFPFYTEQVDQLTTMGKMFASSQLEKAKADGSTGLSESALNQATNSKKVRTGQTIGRAYQKGLERPGFIAPPAEPLRVSMEKEKQLQEEIRQLINLSLANIKPLHASAESRQYENRGLEAGLSCIGLELERCEREIAKIWALFENTTTVAAINYPTNYSLKSDEDRRMAAEAMIKLVSTVPSETFRKATVKDAIAMVMGPKVTAEELQKMQQEVDSAAIIVVDPEILRDDHEAGLVSDETASIARGYPAGDAAKARQDKATRLALILEAQGTARQSSSARGAEGASPDGALENKGEKEISQDGDLNGGRKRVRGQA